MCETIIVRRGRRPPPMMPVDERGELLESLLPMIRRLARRFRSTPLADWEDVAQEVSLTVLIRSGSYGKISRTVAATSWVWNVVRAAVGAEVAKVKRRTEVVLSFDQHEDELGGFLVYSDRPLADDE